MKDRPGKPQGLSREAFDILLTRLGPDRERAGEAYEQVRHKLMRFFEWRGTEWPEELADQTIDRVAQRLAEGAEVPGAKLSAFFHGVAENVLREYWRRPQRPRTPLPPPARPAEHLFECLEWALAKLSPADGELLRRYFQVTHQQRERRRLAGEHSLTLNALRIRVARARRRAEGYFRQHLQEIREPPEGQGGEQDATG